MKVAAVQFAPVFRGHAVNLKTCLTLVRAARSHGAELVVLPELALSGYSYLAAEDARECAEVLNSDDPSRPNSFQAMKALSAELGVAIAWGLIEEDAGTGDLYNAQALVLPSGQWISYRKVNPWGNDYLWAKKGTKSPSIIEFRGKKIGLLICRDVRDTARGIKDFYEPGDADIVCFSANWGDGGFPSGNWIEFAEENGTWLVVSNRYGREINNNFGEGGICVIDPSGKVHCEGVRWSQPCIVYADVP